MHPRSDFLFAARLRVVEAATNRDLWVSEVLNTNETHSSVAFKPLTQPFGHVNLYPNAHFRQAFTKGHLSVVQVGASR